MLTTASPPHPDLLPTRASKGSSALPRGSWCRPRLRFGLVCMSPYIPLPDHLERAAAPGDSRNQASGYLEKVCRRRAGGKLLKPAAGRSICPQIRDNPPVRNSRKKFPKKAGVDWEVVFLGFQDDIYGERGTGSRGFGRSKFALAVWLQGRSGRTRRLHFFKIQLTSCRRLRARVLTIPVLLRPGSRVAGRPSPSLPRHGCSLLPVSGRRLPSLPEMGPSGT